ncbi:MAG: Pyrrolo-quinoline quinone [Pedosphaera sp.]|nr:Pyrrolo-quinoline quinone [Pedosphaera sp.]
MVYALGRIVVVLFLLQSANAADWPQWRGPDRTGHAPSDAAVPATLPVEPKFLWKVKVGDGVASPVVAGGKVFYFDAQAGQETLHALDAKTSKELWQFQVAPVFKDLQSAPGPRCTPLVDGDRVYVQSCQGELKCLNAASGKVIWKTSFTKDFGVTFIGEIGNAAGAVRHGYTASPVIDGTTLFATVGNTNGASIVAFEKQTGRALWKSQNDEVAYSAPIVTTIVGIKQLVVFTVEGVIGLDLKDGKLLWRVPFKTTFGRHVTTPVIFEDMVVVASHEAGLIGIKVSNATGGLQATQAWCNKEAAINFSSPVAVDQYLYGLGPTRNFICVDIKTGKPMWSKDSYIMTDGASAYASFLVLGNNILSLTDGGQLVFFAADPKAFKEISNVQVCGKTWCNPAYADGKLYLRDGRSLLCFQLLP